MNIPHFIFDAIAVFVSTFVFASSIIYLKKNRLWILYWFFFFLFVLPIIFDRVIDFPYYGTNFAYGYTIMGEDPSVPIIYDSFIIFVDLFFYFYMGTKKKEQNEISNHTSLPTNRLFKYILLVASFAPPIMFFLFALLSKRSPFVIFDLGWRYKYENQLPNGEIIGYSAVDRLTYISIVCICILLTSFDYKSIFLSKDEMISKNERTKKIVMMIIYIFSLVLMFGLNVLIQGKRSIFLYSGIVAFITIIFRYLDSKKFWIFAVAFGVFAAAVILVVVFMGDTFRHVSAPGDDFPYKYTLLRIDYFRDQSFKYAIYSMLHSKEAPLLAFPFQSYLTEVFYLFPIVYLPISFKMGYETYLTASVYLATPNEIDSMRITNSGIDEMFANFSFVGVVLFVVTLFFLIKALKKCSIEWKILLTVGFVLFLMYTTSYICWYFEFLLGVIIFEKIISIWRRRRLTKNAKSQ